MTNYEAGMKKLVLIVMGLLCASTVVAAPYTLQFTSTVVTGRSLPAGISVGESFEVYVVVDNGGTTDSNQTWGFADIQSVRYSINSGSYIAIFPSSTFASPSTGGVIQTDGGGRVTSSTADWAAASTPGNMDSSGLELYEWYINGANDMIFYSPCCNPSVGAADSTNDSRLWTVTPGDPSATSAATAVPALPLFGLFALGGLLGLFGLRKLKQ